MAERQDRLPIPDSCLKGGEEGECAAAELVAPHCRSVLEIGAGNGDAAVSRAIQRNLRDPTRHVALEMDPQRCQEHIASAQKEGLQHTVLCKAANDLASEDLSALGGSVDCLIADCEGCLVEFAQTDLGRSVFGSIRFFSNEMDGFTNPSVPDHDDKLRQMLCESKLCPYLPSYGCGTNCESEIWRRDTCKHVQKECKEGKRTSGCICES